MQGEPSECRRHGHKSADREAVKAEIRQTLTDPEQVAEELTHLEQALRRS